MGRPAAEVKYEDNRLWIVTKRKDKIIGYKYPTLLDPFGEAVGFWKHIGDRYKLKDGKIIVNNKMFTYLSNNYPAFAACHWTLWGGEAFVLSK